MQEDRSLTFSPMDILLSYKFFLILNFEEHAKDVQNT